MFIFISIIRWHYILCDRLPNVYVCRFTNTYLKKQKAVYHFLKSVYLFHTLCVDKNDDTAYSIPFQYSMQKTAILLTSKFSYYVIGAKCLYNGIPVFLNKETHSSESENKNRKVIHVFLKNNLYFLSSFNFNHTKNNMGESKLIYSLGHLMSSCFNVLPFNND